MEKGNGDLARTTMVTHRMMLTTIVASMAAAFGLAQTVYVDAGEHPTLEAAVGSCGIAEQCVVTVPAGMYRLRESINLYSGLRIVGEPGAIVDAGETRTKIAFSGTGGATEETSVAELIPDAPYLLRVEDATDLQIGDMLEFGTGLDSHPNELVAIEPGGLLRLRHPVPHFVTQGATVAVVSPLHAVEISGLTIKNTSNPFWFSYARDLTLSNLRIENSELYAAFYRTLRGRIRDCVAVNAMGGGFFASSSTDVMISNSRAENHKLAGFFVRGCSQVHVVGNHAQSTHDYALPDQSGDSYTFVNSQWLTVADNVGLDSSCYGMWLDGVRDATVVRNSITNSFTLGFYMTNSHTSALQHNKAQNIANAHGFAISGGGSHVFTNNTATSVIYGFLVLDASDVIIGRNLAQNVTEAEFIHNAPGLIRR
jgi:parallel beta-helix repeat protein